MGGEGGYESHEQGANHADGHGADQQEEEAANGFEHDGHGKLLGLEDREGAATQQKGHTCVCTKMYWKNHLIKCQIALAKGKQSHDKRATVKDREWNIDKQRIVRQANR